MQNCVVSIICTAYNHERYIAQALDGFLMQETKYPFEILINDDASTDDTAAIIRKYEKEYPDIIKAFYQKKNLFSQGISPVDMLCEKAKGKYIAICEGDDFWVDKGKLETQVEFMETHTEYAICAHAAYRSYENGAIKNNLFSAFPKNCTVPTEEVIRKWIFPTASIVYRLDLRGVQSIPFQQNAPCGDYPLAVYMSLKGKAYYFVKPMSVYRLNSVSSLSRMYMKNTTTKQISWRGMIDLGNRIDIYTNYEYHAAVMCFCDEFENNLEMLNKHKIEKSSSNVSIWFKIKFFLQEKTPKLYEWIYKLYDEINYRRAIQYTRTLKIDNIKISPRIRN